MKIAIKANPDRGKEIISLLKSLGGINKKNWKGDGETDTYYIDEDNKIQFWLAPAGYKIYTLEEFEKEFPFKIGDIVLLKGSNKTYEIIALEWFMDKLCYKLDNGAHYTPRALTTYKEMKEERNIKLTLDKAKEWYKKGGELKEIALQAFTKEELNLLPRSWEEYTSEIALLKVSIDRMPISSLPKKYIALYQLEQLRNHWWNSWKPEWSNSEKYVIKWEGDNLIVFTARRVHAFLVFPTREMAEEFLKCFKDLIEQAGDLI